jgi:Flp pilus assembly pilin Flp
MKNVLLKLWKEEEGQDLLEYALLLVLVVLVAAAAINPLGTTIANIFTSANSCASNPSAATCTT